MQEKTKPFLQQRVILLFSEIACVMVLHILNFDK